MPYGKLLHGGVITPTQWCHVIAADDTNIKVSVYVQLFVGPECITQPHYITLANIKVLLPTSAWGHVYLYDKSPGSDEYTGRVEKLDITRLR